MRELAWLVFAWTLAQARALLRARARVPSRASARVGWGGGWDLYVVGMGMCGDGDGYRGVPIKA